MYQLYHGDCLDILPTLPAQSVDAVICDPPYGTTACKWDSVIPFEPMWKELKRIIKPRGAIVLFGSQPFTSALVMSNPGMFKYSLVWEKTRPTGYMSAETKPLTSHEDVVIFANNAIVYNPQKWIPDPIFIDRRKNINNTGRNASVYGGSSKIRKADTGWRYPQSVLSFASVSGAKHPTQKPLALLEYLVKTYTNEGDTVLDFTFGSGTTGHACGNLGRRFIGIEKDAGYFALGRDRIASAYEPLRAMQEVA